MAEIIRGGLLSVPRGQWETAQAFGMTHGRALRRLILPQAMRAIIPPTGNQLISMIKATSLVSVDRDGATCCIRSRRSTTAPSVTFRC